MSSEAESLCPLSTSGRIFLMSIWQGWRPALVLSGNFSDGSPVTTQDIIYSFNEAKESFAYSSRLANFESIVAANDVNLVVTLKESDPYAANCLTFPIVKKGSNIDRPLGSGRYVLSEESGKYYLTVNPQKTGFSPSITKFELNEIKNAAVINDSLQIGGTCFNRL